MYFQFLVEDKSTGELIDILMKKIAARHLDITYRCKSFKGLGGFTKRNTVKETRTGKLLNDLATYLKGFDKSLRNIPAAIIVVLDNDDHDPSELLRSLRDVAEKNHILLDHTFCIAIEEIEAWLLGDFSAILTAYPAAKTQVLNTYVQDSICGTWEVLADAIYPGGIHKFKKDCPTYVDRGAYKCEWARNIGIHMEPGNNKSPSFQKFIGEIRKRLPENAATTNFN